MSRPAAQPNAAGTQQGVHASAGVGALWMIVRRSLRQHAVSTAVTALAVALASGLVMSVFSIEAQSRAAFTGGPAGFDAVVGARGSELQLVLNTVFHLETSPGNIPWSLYEELERNRMVERAIPYAVGDNYRGFRIVGTTPEIFTDFEYREGQKLTPQQGGRVFDPTRMEAVIGSFVAQKTGLTVGSTFNPYHGLSGGEQHEERYVVVGVLEPTSSPSDRVIWIPIEGIFRMGGHVLRASGEAFEARAGEEIPDEHKEVSAVMLKLRSPQAGVLLDQQINKQGRVATLAWPIGSVMADLFEKIGWMSRVLTLVAYLVVAVSAGAILASIYNTINERRRDFAILRALGARRATVFSAIVLECAAIAGIGALLGFAVYAAVVGGAAVVIREQTGVVLEVLRPHWVLLLTPLGMILAGALVGLVPAVKAYSTDVATNLLPQT